MNVCTCTHPHSQHGERLARTGKVRILADACKVELCACESYSPRPENRDNMREEIRREIALARREFNRRLDALNARLDGLN